MATATHRELTPAEKSRPFAKYYHAPFTVAPKEIYDQLDKGPIKPENALPVQKRNDLLKPGYLPAERGFCVMPDGSVFVAGLTRMPGVTADMIDWWFAWHGLEGLRYSIWDPDDHYDVYVAPEGLERRLNPKLSLRERNWNTTDVVTEDIGTGSMLLDISFMSPEDYGYDMELFKKGALTAVSANLGTHEPKSKLVTFTHVARAIPGGIELRSRFWIGWNIVDKKPVRVGQDVPAEALAAIGKGLVYHCPKEYHNLAAILPKVYAENVNIIDKLEDFRSV
jgi:hypothetical protein